MSKQVLKIEYNYDFSLLGIVSSEKIYRLCWVLNQELPLDLLRTDDLEIFSGNSSTSQYFPRYIDQNSSENEGYIYLLGNKNSGRYVIPDRKEADYFLILNGDAIMENIDSVVNQLKLIKTIQAVYKIDPNILNSKENLIF
ncbi:MAG: IPExxxVDY family protein [Bacteroidia bacterium]|nr:IPExxxVDY family protein [Bacteroidia bacterium]